jgi:subtilisin family serine protease
MAHRRRPRRSPLSFGCRSTEILEARCLLSTAAEFAAGTRANPTYDGIIHAADVRAAFGVDGSGLAAAVIDTGIDYRHPALGGGYGPGYKVSGGADLAMGDPDPLAETWSHGTLVSGLIAGRDSGGGGVAPGANLVGLRVFGNDNQGSFDRIADALQWVLDHHDEYGITVVNLSISDGGNYPMDWYSYDGGIGQRIAGLVDRLAAARIPVVAAAGNSFSGRAGMGFIAILPNTISVTASDPNDRLMPDAQRLGSGGFGGASGTDLAAPGSQLRTTGENGGFWNVDGTSFAAPLVTGSIVLLQQIYRSRFGTLPTVDAVLGWLKQGADRISDPSTGITLGRLNVAGAAALIPAAPAAVPPPASNPTPPVVVAPPTPDPAPPVVVAPPAPDPITPPAATPSTPAAPPAQTGTKSPAKSPSTSPVTATKTPAPVDPAPIQAPATPPAASTNLGTLRLRLNDLARFDRTGAVSKPTPHSKRTTTKAAPKPAASKTHHRRWLGARAGLTLATRSARR